MYLLTFHHCPDLFQHTGENATKDWRWVEDKPLCDTSNQSAQYILAFLPWSVEEDGTGQLRVEKKKSRREFLSSGTVPIIPSKLIKGYLLWHLVTK